ncbi:MAG: 16S rRNA (uracil(1498)-N(3))-methyltransferase [Betaproteobacteria bacterium]|nr:16S rRNA (uracil(1498)-N(3))-methyltransferase [Betaproteobacteria bacterium]
MPRIFCTDALRAGAAISLPGGPARHVQVLRLQPGDGITLFDGRGGEYAATITRMGRNTVDVEVGAHHAVEREAPLAVHLALGIPANERMDWLVEKATELGVASITPLMSTRSVLRVSGERADKKQAHWQAVAVAACEQCGRNRVPPIAAPVAFDAWLRDAPATAPTAAPRLVLSLATDAQPLSVLAAHLHGASPSGPRVVQLLSGPEGGLSPDEEAAARAQGWQALTLGPRTLRAETAPLATLAALTLGAYSGA